MHNQVADGIRKLLEVGQGIEEQWMNAESRIVYPALRQGQDTERISWNRSARIFTERFRALIKEHGTQSVALVVSGQIVNEELAFAGSFFRYGMGCIRGNSCTTQCVTHLFGHAAGLLGWEHFSVPDSDLFAYDRILADLRAGKIKGLWVIATDSLRGAALPQEMAQELDGVEFLAMQGQYCSPELAAKADLVLPAAGWGEKEGTILNAESRIGRTRRMRNAPGMAMADFYIIKLLAEVWGSGELFNRWRTPEDVYRDLLILQEREGAGLPC